MQVVPPKQRRSRVTRDRICEAVLELLEEKPFSALTIEEITLAADCSTSSFYSRFKSKSAVLFVLQERLFAEVDGMLAGLDGVGPGSFSGSVALGKAVLHDYADFRQRNRTLLETLRAAEGDEPEIRRRREALDSRAYREIKRAFLRLLEAPSGGALDRLIENSIWIFPAAARGILGDPSRANREAGDPACRHAIDLLAETAIPRVLPIRCSEEGISHPAASRAEEGVSVGESRAAFEETLDATGSPN